MTEVISGLPSEPYSEIDLSSGSSLFTRRLRHITSVQVRNLTPFPVRDAFTSALLQPTDSLYPARTAIDDFNVPSGRRRPRKISANSVATRSSLKWEDGLHDEDNIGPTGTIRAKRTSVNFASGGDPCGPTNISPQGSSFKAQRPRANSRASSTTSSRVLNSNTSNRTSSFLLDVSQRSLEKIINSRLLETCLVVSVTEPPPQPSGSESQPFTLKATGLPTASMSPVKAKQSPTLSPQGKSQIRGFPSSRHDSISSLNGRIRSPSPEYPTDTASHDTTLSSPAEPRKSRLLPTVNGKPKIVPATQVKVQPKLSQSLDTPEHRPLETTVLTYRSPVHRSSTNPIFTLDSGSISQSVEWARLNAQSFKVAIWGKLPAEIHRAGWDEQATPPYPDEPGYRWRLIQEWDVNLQDLTPLPDDIGDIPSNTLILTLGPHGRRFRIAPSKGPQSRPPSPANGYASDPESELHKVKRVLPGSSELTVGDSHAQLRRRRRGPNLSDSKGTATTATWPDLFQLATLQALIYDNEASLSAISAKVDQLIAEDEISPLKRDINERQDRISDLNVDHQKVLDACAQKRKSIQEREGLLKQRRELLALARQSIGEAEEAEMHIADRVDEERSQLASLRITVASMRACLISTLTEIFPIELRSPADLLFTIFDVALPLPASPHDPAPPLSVPEHKEINEETVATALGYVAQVLQILAAYLGVNLLYPVTCIGSRSLIRDNISAMIGPRMFPLYSKGVDTYRFEYAVFLLNKNIEILMVEKDLRALDMRHTLPNLKNLLLILSHDNARSDIPKSKIPDPSSSSLSLLTLDSETDANPEMATSETPKATQRTETGEAHTPPRSGATTPTPNPAGGESRGSRFLGFAPFTGFLRGRYPSTSRASTHSTVNASERTEVGGDEGDEEDRATIHGLVRDVDGARGKDEAKAPFVENHLSEPKQHGADHDISIPETLSPET